MRLQDRPHKASTRGHRATWNGVVIAKADDTIRVDGRDYFPPDTIDWDHLVPSDATSICPWKGVATYYDVVADERTLPAAAWSYKSPSPAAEAIAGRVAFWRGVEVTSLPG